MKQRTVVKGIINVQGRVLLLRRSGGRPSIDGKYELPGGRIHINQQPEDALRHAMSIHAGVTPESIRLADVMTFIDPDDRLLQYLFVLYQVTLHPASQQINPTLGYDKYVWQSPEKIRHNQLTLSTQQQLSLVPIPYGKGRSVPSRSVDLDTSYGSVDIWTDGGSRGNPGPSAAGYVVMNTSGSVITENGAFLGTTTSDVAEYEAVYLGLEHALRLGARSARVHIDSQLVVHQLTGVHGVRSQRLRPVFNRTLELIKQYPDGVTFQLVKRENNHLADGVVNRTLDRNVL